MGRAGSSMPLRTPEGLKRSLHSAAQGARRPRTLFAPAWVSRRCRKWRRRHPKIEVADIVDENVTVTKHAFEVRVNGREMVKSGTRLDELALGQ